MVETFFSYVKHSSSNLEHKFVKNLGQSIGISATSAVVTLAATHNLEATAAVGFGSFIASEVYLCTHG